jgi:hypothetical protein
MVAERKSKNLSRSLALLALRAAELQPGKTVLAPAIGGSMGNAMAQMARALDEKRALVGLAWGVCHSNTN